MSLVPVVKVINEVVEVVFVENLRGAGVFVAVEVNPAVMHRVPVVSI